MAQIACLHCDLLISPVDIRQGECAVCPRCQQTIYLDQQSLNASLALLVTALLLYFPAMLLPFIAMEASGRTQQVSLLSSITEIAHGDMLLLAVTVFALVVLFPLLKIVGLLLVVLPLSQSRQPFFHVTTTRYILRTSSWSMIEVYLVGVLVTLVKLTGIARIEFSGGFYAFIALIVVNTLISLNLPQMRIWQNIAYLKKHKKPKNFRQDTVASRSQQELS